MRLRGKISILIFLLAAGITAGAVLNMETSITQGVDGQYRKIMMPLYVKWIEFLGRHYEYSRIAKEITAGCRTEEEKALAILKWTGENIDKDMAEEMPVVDDHILNIIIRGYGTNDQFQDVFTALCVYSGIPAFWKKAYDSKHAAWIPLSFVKLGGRWRVFDAYHGMYFRNTKGEIAGAEDIAADKSIVRDESIDRLEYNGVPYKEFYYNLEPVKAPAVLRAEKQMPMNRIIYEIRRKIDNREEGDRI